MLSHFPPLQNPHTPWLHGFTWSCGASVKLSCLPTTPRIHIIHHIRRYNEELRERELHHSTGTCALQTVSPRDCTESDLSLSQNSQHREGIPKAAQPAGTGWLLTAVRVSPLKSHHGHFLMFSVTIAGATEFRSRK